MAISRDEDEEFLFSLENFPIKRSLNGKTISTVSSSIVVSRDRPFPSEEDEHVRNLDTPVSRFIRQAEEEALNVGHENKGFLSFRNGFLPMFYPEQSLPTKFQAWDEMGKNLSTMMSDLTVRHFVEHKLPLLSAGELDDRYLFRAALLLGLTAHAYWYCGPKEPEFLPPSLKDPWDKINSRLVRKGSYLSGEDVQLYNFSYAMDEEISGCISGTPFDSNSDAFRIENLNMLQSMWGNKAEIIFHLAFGEMAKAAAPVLRHVCMAQDAVQRGDDELLLSTLHAMANSIEQIQAAFMRIIPDPNAKLGIDPLAWAKTVAPVGVSINKGMPSPSGLGTPFFHCLDVFFSRGVYSSILGKDSIGARDFFPENWLGVLNAISSTSIHVYISGCDNIELHTAWANAIDVYASWNGLLGKHLQKTYNFLELAFKTGRDMTLGGFKGGFSDRTWDRIMDMLDKSREERLSAKSNTLKLSVATLRSSQGEGSMQTLIYELPHDGFNWSPGDKVSVWPQNSSSDVARVLEAMCATGDELVPLDETWRLHLKKFVKNLGMRKGTRSQTAKLRDIIRFAKLNSTPTKTFQYLTSFFPGIAYCNNQALNYNIFQLFGHVRLLHGDQSLKVDEGGEMPGLKLLSQSKLYEQFLAAKKGSSPLVEDIVKTLHDIGTADNIPVINSRMIDFDVFAKQVYPLFAALMDKDERSGSIVNLLCPIEPRHYSIANMRNQSDPCLKLVVSRLKYKQEIKYGSTLNEMDGWRNSSRSAMLADKYFKRWMAKALEKKIEHQPRGNRSTTAVRFLGQQFIELLGPSTSTVTVNGVASNYLNDKGPLLFTVESNLSFHPPPASEPLLMVASGSGLAPFLGYLEERVAKKSTAKTILMWTISYIKEGQHILHDLEKMLEETDSNNIDIIVCISRENVWPVFRDGKFHMQSRPRSRLPELLERDIDLRMRVNNMMLPRKYGGSGGYTFFCGSAPFVRSTLDVMSDVVSDTSLFEDPSCLEAFTKDEHKNGRAKWLIQELQSDEKIIYEVFTDSAGQGLPSFPISELVTKNDPRGESWISIYGQVYDVSSFVHPGGERILHAYCGMDATVAWEAVRHHRSQSLNAKLATLQVGSLHLPKFTPLPRLALNGEKSTDLNGVFHAWSKLLQEIVEIENAMKMEFSLRSLHIAGSSSAEVMTPMKLQMLFQAHRRFVFVHIQSIMLGMDTALEYKEAVRTPINFEAFSLKNGRFLATDNQMHGELLEAISSGKGTLQMLLACDKFVAACHQINGAESCEAGQDNKLIDSLTTSTKTVQDLDLGLLGKWKASMRSVMIYMEQYDTRKMSLPRLYHKLHSTYMSMMLDLNAYISSVSSGIVVGQLFEHVGVTSNDLAVYENSWLNLTVKTGITGGPPGWQREIKA